MNKIKLRCVYPGGSQLMLYKIYEGILLKFSASGAYLVVTNELKEAQYFVTVVNHRKRSYKAHRFMTV